MTTHDSDRPRREVRPGDLAIAECGTVLFAVQVGRFGARVSSGGKLQDVLASSLIPLVAADEVPELLKSHAALVEMLKRFGDECPTEFDDARLGYEVRQVERAWIEDAKAALATATALDLGAQPQRENDCVR